MRLLRPVAETNAPARASSTAIARPAPRVAPATNATRSDSSYQALGHVVGESLADERPLSLPVSTDPVVAAATDYTRAHLEHVTVNEVTRAVGVSDRTLRRLFDTHLGMSWRSYLLRAPCASRDEPADRTRPFGTRCLHRRGFRRRQRLRSIVRQTLRRDTFRIQTTDQSSTLTGYISGQYRSQVRRDP